MSVTRDLLGISYSLPETNERFWGSALTSYLDKLGQVLDAIAGGSSAFFPLFAPADSVLAAGATLTPTNAWHRVSGSGGAVSLSATTAIADGAFPGQPLFLTGTHATNTVSMVDAANVNLNGNITLGLGSAILFLWDATLGHWEEIARKE